MKRFVAAVLWMVVATVAQAGRSNFLEDFGPGSESAWVQSSDSRYEGSEWEWTDAGAAEPGDVGIRTSAAPKFYGLTRVLDEPVVVGNGKDFVVQYEVKNANGVTCSGSYLKLLIQDDDFKPENLVESSPYSIMFGPDNCGATHKVHVIFRQQNPVTKEWEEKHMSAKVTPVQDKTSHLYTLEVLRDNKFKVKIDNQEKASGSLVEDGDFKPSFNQPKETDDPEDKKPADWVDKKEIPDPNAVKPDDWDEDAPLKIPDPDAVKPDGWLDDEPEEIPDPVASRPEDWDEEDDGEWEAPLIANPKCEVGCGKWTAPLINNPDYKGKWKAPMIPNPEYIGEWKPRKIANPGFFEESNPVNTIPPIGAIAIEILANDKGIHFDNIMIGNDIAEAEQFAESVFAEKSKKEKDTSKSVEMEDEIARFKSMMENGEPFGYLLYYGADIILPLKELVDVPPEYIVGGAVLSLVILSFILFGLCGSSKKPVEGAAALHKKDDDAPADEDDDKDGEDEGEEEDDEAEDEDDENEDGKGATRRRVGRT